MARRFTLAEAQSLIPEVSHLLRDAVLLKGVYQAAGQAIQTWMQRITMMGGMTVDGRPSGGPYPADAVVLYDWTSPAANANAQSDGASQETCLLPTSERALCSAINQDFVSRAWMMPG